MADGSFFKSTPVRVSIIYIVLFMTAYLGANIVAARLVWNFLDARLDSIVLERYREIESAYSERGLLGAVSMINSHGPAIRGEETIYTLSTPSHIVLAGNAALINITPGSSSIDFLQEDGREISYKLFKGKLGNNDLVVGISSGGSDALARIVSVDHCDCVRHWVGRGGRPALPHTTSDHLPVANGACYRPWRIVKTTSHIGETGRNRRLFPRNQRGIDKARSERRRHEAGDH